MSCFVYIDSAPAWRHVYCMVTNCNGSLSALNQTPYMLKNTYEFNENSLMKFWVAYPRRNVVYDGESVLINI